MFRSRRVALERGRDALVAIKSIMSFGLRPFGAPTFPHEPGTGTLGNCNVCGSILYPTPGMFGIPDNTFVTGHITA